MTNTLSHIESHYIVIKVTIHQASNRRKAYKYVINLKTAINKLDS